MGLSPDAFRPLYGLSDDELARRGARRYIADAKPGFRDRSLDLQGGRTPRRADHEARCHRQSSKHR